VMIQLNPASNAPMPWIQELPEPWGGGGEVAPLRIEDNVRTLLRQAGLYLHSSWYFSVPEWFASPADLYVCLIWGRDPQSVPPFEEARPAIESVFARHAGRSGLVIQHERFLWKAALERP